MPLSERAPSALRIQSGSAGDMSKQIDLLRAARCLEWTAVERRPGAGKPFPARQPGVQADGLGIFAFAMHARTQPAVVCLAARQSRIRFMTSGLEWHVPSPPVLKSGLHFVRQPLRHRPASSAPTLRTAAYTDSSSWSFKNGVFGAISIFSGTLGTRAGAGSFAATDPSLLHRAGVVIGLRKQSGVQRLHAEVVHRHDASLCYAGCQVEQCPPAGWFSARKWK